MKPLSTSFPNFSLLPQLLELHDGMIVEVQSFLLFFLSNISLAAECMISDRVDFLNLP